MSEQDFIGEIMGFNPQDLSAFQEEEEKKSYDENVYKTNPVRTKVVSEDGHYRSVVKILYNPFNVKKSIINQCLYVLQDEQGYLFVRSALADGDKNCPLFKGWKKLWFSGDENKKQYAREMFDRTESQWVLVQIIEDDNQPDLVGRLMVMKLPKSIYNKMVAKMNPSADSKKTPVPLMDYLVGPVLEMDVTPGPNDPAQPSRRQREISYDLCDFGTDPTPIIKTDGTPLFTDEELELIEDYATAKTNLDKAKTDAKREQLKHELSEMVTKVRELYSKALSYLKENAVDVEKECGYQPWSEATAERVNKWLDAVTNMRDPKGEVTVDLQTPPEEIDVEIAATKDDVVDFVNMEKDLPF